MRRDAFRIGRANTASSLANAGQPSTIQISFPGSSPAPPSQPPRAGPSPFPPPAGNGERTSARLLERGLAAASSTRREPRARGIVGERRAEREVTGSALRSFRQLCADCMPRKTRAIPSCAAESGTQASASRRIQARAATARRRRATRGEGKPRLPLMSCFGAQLRPRAHLRQASEKYCSCGVNTRRRRRRGVRLAQRSFLRSALRRPRPRAPGVTSLAALAYSRDHSRTR